MRLTVLVDNNTLIDQYHLGEPAASYYLEADGLRVLFDTGYSRILLENAKSLGVDLGGLTHIVLSHGHNDHTNGLRFLLGEGRAPAAALVAHPDCLLPKYLDGEAIGAPYSPAEAAALAPCRFSAAPLWLSEHLCFLGGIPRVTAFEAKEPIGCLCRNGLREPDFLPDDTGLVYRAPEGLFIVTGCSHSGICNIVSRAKAVCGCDRILGILGGFHLMDDPARTAQTAAFLRRCGVDMLYPCHCVSLAAKAALLQSLPVTEVGVGLRLSL